MRRIIKVKAWVSPKAIQKCVRIYNSTFREKIIRAAIVTCNFEPRMLTLEKSDCEFGVHAYALYGMNSLSRKVRCYETIGRGCNWNQTLREAEELFAEVVTRNDGNIINIDTTTPDDKTSNIVDFTMLGINSIKEMINNVRPYVRQHKHRRKNTKESKDKSKVI